MTDRIRVGNVEIVAVLDMVPPPRDPTVFITDVPREAWEPYEDEVLENGLLQLYYGCFFLRSQGKTVLVDTGMGPGPHAHLEGRTGNLLGQLAANSVTPDDVDIVVSILTFIRTMSAGMWTAPAPRTSPTFPMRGTSAPARTGSISHVPKSCPLRPTFPGTSFRLTISGLIDFIDDGHNVTDEITTLETPGHTPGHQVILVSSQGEKAAIIGDLIHNPVQIYEPDWCAFVDTSPDDTRRSRKSFMERAEREDMIVAAGHFHPDRHIGRFVRLQGRRYWQAVYNSESVENR